jgi:hypothetical protein
MWHAEYGAFNMWMNVSEVGFPGKKNSSSIWGPNRLNQLRVRTLRWERLVEIFLMIVAGWLRMENSDNAECIDWQ